MNKLLENPNGLLTHSYSSSQSDVYQRSPGISPSVSSVGDIGSYYQGFSANIQDLQLGSAGQGALPLNDSGSTSSTK